MTRRRPLLILMLLATLTLALPASPALAQSAGDDQYQDPLGGNDTSGGGGNDTSGGGNDSTPSRPAQSGGGNTAPSAPAQAPKATRSVPLARTGFNAWIPGVAGLILLVAGASLLVRTRRRPS